MSTAQITWWLKASKTNINDSNNYTVYNAFDDTYLISPSIMESVIEILSSMNYNIQTYEFINHHKHCAKWCIVFDINEYETFRKDNMKTLIHFTSGLYNTSSIYVKHLSPDDDTDTSDNDSSDSDEWKKIYKNKNI
jgi:hypothetical protein